MVKGLLKKLASKSLTVAEKWQHQQLRRLNIHEYQTFNEVQNLLSKTDGKAVGDVMTPASLVVRENTNLEDAARFHQPCSSIN